MKNTFRSFAHLSNEQLLLEVRALAGREREATAHMIASLAELDARQLYLGEGYSSLFTYCTLCLHLSEHAAYGRIAAARAARKWPVVLEMLAEGSINLTTVCLLAGHLTAENHLAVLGAAQHQTRREVEQQVAALRPLPPVPASIRKLPAPKLAVEPRPVAVMPDTPVMTLTDPPAAATPDPAPFVPPAPPRRPAAVTPLAPERFKMQLTISRETYDKLRRVQDLLRHSVPNGDPAEILDRALTLLLANLERKKLAATRRPRQAKDSAPGSRHVPAAIRREVWMRDAGRCAFVGTAGRCSERGFLEFHHVIPFAEGGETTRANLQLRCRAHNLYEANRDLAVRFTREPATELELRRSPLATEIQTGGGATVTS
jgi:5-methylcytosine-specific restriction endonuclease McrA